MTGYHDVICCIHETEKFAAIREVVYSCPVFSDLADKDHFIDAVVRRERIETTGIGRGVAIAHGKVRDIDRVRVALGISPQGVDFRSPGGDLVHLLFVIGSSPLRQVEYLKTLASIMRFVKHKTVRRELVRRAEQIDFDGGGDDACMDFMNLMAGQQFAAFFDTKFRSHS